MSLHLRRVCVLTNPESGTGSSARPALAAAFTPAGIEWDVRTIHHPERASEMAAHAAAEGYDAVIACGGDGTVAAVASGLMHGTTPLGVLPCGTGNGFAHQLGLPERLIEVAQLYAEGNAMIRRLDVGSINGRVFLLRAGVGLIAEVDGQASRRLKKRLGPLAYVVGAARSLPKSGWVEYRVEGDGGLLACRAVACIVANGAAMGKSEFGMGIDIAPDDGLVDVMLYNGEHAAGLNRIAGAFGYAFSTKELPPVPSIRGTAFTITADPPQPVVSDGEDAGMTPADVRLYPGALLALAPRAAAVTPVGQAVVAY